MDATYRDKREELFRRYYEQSPNYESYLSSGDAQHASKWRNIEKEIAAIDPSVLDPLNTFIRKMPVLVLSGIWCGDCVRQGPMFRAIETRAPLISFRYVENRKFPELQEELRLNGAEKVPVVVALNEDFHEVQRYGDRHLSVYRRKAMKELGPACDPGILTPPGEELIAELREWIAFFERIQFMLRLAPKLRKRHND